MTHSNSVWKSRTAGALSFSLPLIVYLKTLLPGVGGYGDTAKFQFAGRVLALTHPSGFPVYLWLTRLASYLPVGDLAYRANLISALCGALTAYFLFDILRQVPLPPMLALGATLMFAFSSTFWSVSLIAEVYTLNALFMASVISLLWKWREGRSWYLEFACVLYGLSLGNHLVISIVFPAAAYWIVLARDKFRAEDRYAARAALFLSAALIPYLWLCLRFGQTVVYREESVDSLGGFIGFVMGSSFASNRFPLTLRELIRIAGPIYGSLLRSQYGIPAILIGAFGLARLWRVARDKAIFLIIIFAGDLIISMNSTSIETPVYYIPSYFVFAILIGCAFMPSRAELPGKKARGGGARLFAAFILCAYAFYLVYDNMPLVNLSGKTFYSEFSDRVLNAVPRGSVILSPNYNWTEVYLYRLLGEGARRGDDVVVLHQWDIAKMRDYLSGRSIEPPFCTLRGKLPDRMRLFLQLHSPTDPLLARLGSKGFIVKPFLEQRSKFVRALKTAPEEHIILLSLRDEGIAILNDDSYDALTALGLKTVVSRGRFSGWGFAGILSARGGRLAGLQANKFQPVKLQCRNGDAIPGTGLIAPDDLVVESCGIGRGDRSLIIYGGKELQLGSHGLNYARLDARNGKVIESSTTPPARLHSLREAFLMEIVDAGGADGITPPAPPKRSP